MEFSEIGEKLGGLTADQVFTLAEYGKDILGIAGIYPLTLHLTEFIAEVLVSEINAEGYKYIMANILQIAKRTEELERKCWERKKTPLGLIGSKYDNLFFGLGNATELSDVKK